LTTLGQVLIWDKSGVLLGMTTLTNTLRTQWTFWDLHGNPLEPHWNTSRNEKSHSLTLPKRKSHKEHIGNFMGTLSKLDGHMKAIHDKYPHHTKIWTQDPPIEKKEVITIVSHHYTKV
jgi:hypothetical protein